VSTSAPSVTVASAPVAPVARLLVAEDEAPMRERLLEQLAVAWPQARVVAVADNGLDAWAAFLEHEPDTVFLDIRMPGMSGLDLAARISGAASGPGGRAVRIVFVTAYDQYAVAAFDRGAVDYLLKPVELDRLQRCVQRLTRPADTAAAPATAAITDLGGVLRQLRGQEAAATPTRTRWIKASVGRKIRLIAVDEVLFFQADTKYTRVVFADGEALIRTPLRELIGGLDPELFWQVHRSVVVNARAVDSAERIDAERLEVLIKGRSERLPVSRAFAHLFKD
jgi:DNA-binding LytR/AlgR family response regulator